MKKEKVTEEFVRQNGNQAAAVMADYAGQGGGGGSTGIPTIDKNTQPNLVQRDATDEDKAKFITNPIVSVVDIQDGKLPLFMVNSIPTNPVDPSAESITLGVSLTNVTFPTEDNDGTVRYGDKDQGVLFYISRDWTLLGIQGME